MTADRDALAGIIYNWRFDLDETRNDAEPLADAIIAAGWRAPVTWKCGHPYRAGAWGHNGECIQCATSPPAPTR